MMIYLNKMDFFYKPYEKKTDAGIPICIKFGQTSADNKSKNNLKERSRKNWRSISSRVLESKPEEFKDLIKAVNSSFYYQIRKESKASRQRRMRKETEIGLSFLKKPISKIQNPKSPSHKLHMPHQGQGFSPRKSLFISVLKQRRSKQLKSSRAAKPLGRPLTAQNFFGA